MISKANNPHLKSWIAVDANSDFPIQNIPFGIFSSTNNSSPRVGVAIGDQVLDVAGLAEKGYLDDLNLPNDVFSESTLNAFISLGKQATRTLRERLSDLLNVENNTLQGAADRDQLFFAQNEVSMHLPARIGDYTDFYSSIEHATNVGTMFRDPKNALLPNWKHIPVGYHGRSSSIIVSGHPIHRPKGQTKADDAPAPTFGPTRLLDFEL